MASLNDSTPLAWQRQPVPLAPMSYSNNEAVYMMPRGDRFSPSPPPPPFPPVLPPAFPLAFKEPPEWVQSPGFRVRKRSANSTCRKPSPTHPTRSRLASEVLDLKKSNWPNQLVVDANESWAACHVERLSIPGGGVTMGDYVQFVRADRPTSSNSRKMRRLHWATTSKTFRNASKLTRLYLQR